MINRINTARQVKALLALLLPLNVVKLLLKLSIHSTNERQVSEEEVRIVLQAHAEGSSLRGISLISGLAYNTVVSIVQAAALKAQMVHNASHQDVDTDAIAADELWSVCP
jgi:lambda repressor-like predicted transcriptional regulator